jgi:hypothetical protein
LNFVLIVPAIVAFRDRRSVGPHGFQRSGAMLSARLFLADCGADMLPL